MIDGIEIPQKKLLKLKQNQAKSWKKGKQQRNVSITSIKDLSKSVRFSVFGLIPHERFTFAFIVKLKKIETKRYANYKTSYIWKIELAVSLSYYYKDCAQTKNANNN